jgi:hypothetical protein
MLWAGQVISGISCGISTAKGIPAGGMGLLSQETIGMIGASLGCTDLGCVIAMVAEGTTVATTSAAHIVTKEDDVRLAESLLFTGVGDIQVTLTWDTDDTDIDLWCTDPSGFKIYYSEPNSPDGGELDFDDTDGFGPENIYWPEGGAPAGNYFVQVHYYDSEGPTTTYTVLIQAFGQTNQYTGQLNPDEVVDIATFSSGKAGILPILKVNGKQVATQPKK